MQNESKILLISCEKNANGAKMIAKRMQMMQNVLSCIIFSIEYLDKFAFQENENLGAAFPETIFLNFQKRAVGGVRRVVMNKR